MSRILNLQGLEDSAAASPDTATIYSSVSVSACSFSTFSIVACISLPVRD